MERIGKTGFIAEGNRTGDDLPIAGVTPDGVIIRTKGKAFNPADAGINAGLCQIAVDAVDEAAEETKEPDETAEENAEIEADGEESEADGE